MTGTVAGVALWLVIILTTNVLATRSARSCALRSYGTDAAIARCYTDRQLDPPKNFDAITE
jgi:hypothetical protein